MEMQGLNARFASQEQAEEAVRKLKALRGDRFRMECAADGADFGSRSPAANAKKQAAANQMLYGGAELEAADELGDLSEETPSSGASFSLSANVPIAALEQARRVISEAGGQWI